MKICMAAAFDIRNARSWSGTPYSLFCALDALPQTEIDTLDLSALHTGVLLRRNTLRHLDVARTLREKKAVSKLGVSRMNPLNSSLLRKHCSKDDYDVLLEFGGFLPSKDLPPYYVYTDSSHDLSLDFYAEQGHLPYGYRAEDLEDVRRAAAFVRPIYQNAQGVFCMSRWLARSMIETTGVPAERVHVVYAGANWHGVTAPSVGHARAVGDPQQIHLLLTGVTYIGKGVDLAVQAVERLNESGSVRYVLHVCGLREDFPHGEDVVNHGFVDKTALSELLGSCDLFVLPSRFDCFGIAFVEAMAYGLPCVGRNICAMPEIIDRGSNGELIESDDPQELASAIRKICEDPALYARYSESALQKAKRFTWENVARDMMRVIEGK